MREDAHHLVQSHSQDLEMPIVGFAQWADLVGHANVKLIQQGVRPKPECTQARQVGSFAFPKSYCRYVFVESAMGLDIRVDRPLEPVFGGHAEFLARKPVCLTLVCLRASLLSGAS